MHDITVNFKNCQPLYIKLDSNAVAQEWKKLFQKNLEHSLPIYKDSKDDSVTRLQKLVSEANQKLDWNYNSNIQTIDDTVRLHKHIEQICAEGFASIPAEYDNLIHDIHACIHHLEAAGEFTEINQVPPHDGILTLEWYNDDGFPLDRNFNHKLNLEVGDIKLQNPYVGHSPLQVYRTNDYSNINQTCKFHDLIRPGLTIVTDVHNRNDFSLSQYINWWKTYALDFVSKHGIETIMHYTGHPVIGRVVNIENIPDCINSTLDSITISY
jgi:hypothetical protein